MSSGIHERRMVAYCHFLTWLHAAGATLYLVAPSFFFDVLNFMARAAGLREIPARSEDFWRALAVSMMYMVAVCCALAARNMRKNLDVLLVVIVSKLVSTAQFVVYVTQTHGQIAHVSGLIVDSFLFASVGYGYLKVRDELRGEVGHSVRTSAGQ